MKDLEIYLALVVLAVVGIVFVVFVTVIEIIGAVVSKVEGWRRGTGR